MRTFIFLLIASLPFGASAQLEWRLSIKLIADTNNNAPPNAFVNISNEVLIANQLLDSYGRGYRFRLNEILTLTGVSQWYNMQARNNSNKLALQAAARANPSLYAYRTNAANVYVVNSFSGVCSFPGDGDDIILLGANAYRTLLLHESGHYFNLLHTHNTEQFLNSDNSNCTNQCSCAQLISGDDNTAETALDHECWNSRDQVAVGAFGAAYTNLNSDQQWRVDNTWLNIMSYHPPANLTILTDDQLDFVTDASNTSRFNAATGRTRFVDRTHAGAEDGSRANPFRGVGQGVVAAAPGDIVLIRAGNYNEGATYAKRVTLRATRGVATIGRP